VDERGLARVRQQLQEFAAGVFAGLPRVDQRETGVRYLRGLMLDGRRKSMQPMAARLGVDHQQLQQFLTSSTWDVVGVRRRLAVSAVEMVAPTVWVVDDTGFAKDGPASACVARQYSGTLGKVGNCQIAVSVHAACDAASAVLDWRLFVPESWDETCVPDEAGKVANGHARRLRRQPTTLDEAGKKKPHVRKEVPREERIAQILRRRAGSKIPDSERYRPKWLMALEMIDELAGWGLRPPLLTADAGYGQVAEFRQGLSDRGIPYIVATTSSTTVQPGDAEPVEVIYAGVGQYPAPRYPHPARSIKDLASRSARTTPRSCTGVNGYPPKKAPATGQPPRCPGTSSPCVHAPPAERPGAAPHSTVTVFCPTAGCSYSGHPGTTSPATTGCPTYPPTRP
jgi:SRSO17 transposase